MWDSNVSPPYILRLIVLEILVHVGHSVYIGFLLPMLSLVGYRWEYRLIHGTRNPFDLFRHEPCYSPHFYLEFHIKGSFWPKNQFYGWSSSICSLWYQLAQFYLLLSKTSGAVLFVPMHIQWRSSICSEAYLVEQFYLFRRTMSGAVLFVPAHIKWSSSICSEAIWVAQFYLCRCIFNETVLFVPAHN